MKWEPKIPEKPAEYASGPIHPTPRSESR